eukprot:5816332-Amphidinium_carterae.1
MAKIDVALLDHIGQAEGLQGLRLQLAEDDLNLEEKAEKGRKMLTSEAYLFIDSKVQSEIKTMVDIVSNLASTRRPRKPTAQTEWQIATWASLINLFSVPAASASPDAVVPIRGEVAVAECLDKLKLKDVKDVKLLEQLEVWLPLMNADQSKQVEEARGKLGAKDKRAQAKKADMESKDKRKVMKTSSAEQDAEAAVMAMLKRKRT